MKHSFQAGFGIALIIAVIALVAIGGGAYYVSQQSDTRTESMQHNVSDTEMAKEKTQIDKKTEDGSRETVDTNVEMKENMAANDGTDVGVMTDAGLIIDEDTEVDTSFLPESEVRGTYTTYTDGSQLALAESGDVVLFFHASWCPSCRALEADIKANLSDIPTDVHLLKVDYDRATELKKKYGVVRQHTLVQVDAQGNMVKTLSGLVNTLDQVVSQI